ncbi:MAG: helix-turn-helix transcriptional regulator [Myxococcota bacterium]
MDPTFGRELRRLRNTRCWSQRQLAERAKQADSSCAVHQSRISEYENELSTPDWIQLHALIEALDLTGAESEGLRGAWQRTKTYRRRGRRSVPCAEL